MTKIPINASYLDEMQKTLDAYSALLRNWREVVAAAEKAGVDPKLNGIQTVRWNLENALEMAEGLVGGIAQIEHEAKKRGAALHDKKPNRRK